MKAEKLTNAKIVRILDEHSAIVAKGVKYWIIDENGRRISKKYTVGSGFERIVSHFRPIRQLLRISIFHIIPLKNEEMLVTKKKRTYIINKNGKIVSEFAGYRGNKPAQRGICVADTGDIFFGEYTVNLSNKNPTSLYRSSDNGRTFTEIYRFEKDAIRHIHFVQWDPYERCLWMGTGDRDCESMIFRSGDYGDTWEKIGGGSQNWRAEGMVFTEDAIYWGTDAGSVSDPSYVIRMDRRERTTQILDQINGPCHSSAVNANGDIYFATGVEGGENEPDRYARLYLLKGDHLQEALKMKKDILPLIIQYGLIRFPAGMEKRRDVVFTSFGLVRGGESVFRWS